ncbi:MAG: Wzz/FepE/Etk N-terminal domain-containing protein [Candidatus Gastranaerophilales bacterium]|nr:Wzz/FepE/Etk N-terminal domain-containing protein [Candidatus Gastranaerophilales bacterium]
MTTETAFLNILNGNRFFRNFKRDKKLISSVMIICLSWALVYLLLFYKPGYESKATVWIRNLATEEFVASLDTQSQLQPLTTAGNPILTQIEILKSEQLKNAIVNYKEKQGEKISPAAVEFEVKNKINTDMLGLSYKDKTPQKAQDTLKEALKEYENINLSINRKIKTSRREYIDVKLKEIDDKLHKVRTDIKEYKTKNLAIDIEEKSSKLVEQEIYMSSKLEDTIAEIKNTNASIKELVKQLSLGPKEAINAVALGSGNQNLVKLRENLNEAVQQYEFDSAKLADTNPKMIAQKNKINTINSQIKKQIELSIGKYAQSQKINIFDPVRESLVRDLADDQAKFMGLKASENAIKLSIKKINNEQAKMPEQKFNLDNLEQEEFTLSEAYNQLKQKQIEAKIKEAEAVSNIIVVDAPDLPKHPSFPTAFQTIILGIILGFGAGLGVSGLKTLIEDVCDDIETIEKITGTSIVGTIPWVENFESPEQVRSIHGLAYDNIASNLMIKCYKNNKKVLTFTSSSLKKTQPTIAYQIATRLKNSGHSVIIVDSDLRIPTTIKTTHSENKAIVNLSDLIVSLEKKLHEVQEGQEQNFSRHQEFIINREIMNAIITDDKGINHIGNKDVVFEPYEFFTTSAFEYIITYLRKKFDWVLIDTGVAHITPEFLIISKLSDGVVLLLDKIITYNIITTITKSLKNAHIPLIGTIVRESDSKLSTEYKKYLRLQQNNSSTKFKG